MLSEHDAWLQAFGAAGAGAAAGPSLAPRAAAVSTEHGGRGADRALNIGAVSGADAAGNEAVASADFVIYITANKAKAAAGDA